MFASENGLKVSVEDAKCVLANAFIQAALFQQFVLREEQITFKINLTVLMVWCFTHSLDLKNFTLEFCNIFSPVHDVCEKNYSNNLSTLSDSPELAKRLAGKIVSEMTCFVLGGMQNLSSINQTSLIVV